MNAKTLIGRRGSLVAACVLAVVPGASTSQDDWKAGAEGVRAGTGKVIVKIGAVGALDGSGVAGKKFKLAGDRYMIPEHGWPQFEHGGKKLGFGAPTPTVPLDSEERKQWRTDVWTFKFDKLRDRQVLYAYYLWPPNEQNGQDEEAIKAVLDAVGEAEGFSAAIGVEYDFSGNKEVVATGLYGSAAVPVEWTKETYDFITAEHDPKTIAALVDATAAALPTGAYVNYGAVDTWSAGANVAHMTGVEPEPSESWSPEAAAAYLKMVSKGPFGWSYLEPIASFIAVDRELNVEGLEVKRILTSKGAWKGMMGVDAGISEGKWLKD